MSAVMHPWATVEDPWSVDETTAQFGEVVRDASDSLTRFEGGGYGADFWRQVVALGWHTALLDEDFGGLGLTAVDLAEIIAPMAVAGSAHAYLGPAVHAVSLLQSVRGVRAEELLGDIGGRGVRLHVALAETASAPCSVPPSTTVQRSAAGWTLSGVKVFVPFADAAEGFLIVARDSDSGTSSLVHVPAGAVGVSLRRHDSLAMPLFDVLLDEIELPAEAVLASGSAVDEAIEGLVDLAVALDSVALVALGSEALGLLVAYSRERIVFDNPLERLQAVQHHATNAFLRVQQARVLARDALAPRNDSVERSFACSLAKIKAGEGIIEAMRLVHRVHGGIGFYDDYPLAALTRRAVAIQGLHGSTAWHRRRVQVLLDDPSNVLERTILRSTK